MPIGEPERKTQNRVVKLFQDALGYTYMGDLSDRQGNSHVEEEPLTAFLKRSDYTEEQIGAAIHQLKVAATDSNQSLYHRNKAVYALLRYGCDVKTDAGQPTSKVHLINWKDPTSNDFAIAEEVTLTGGLERRPDIVLYINGIAIAVLELKNSRVSIGDGIRQNLSNQQPEFNEWFFSTIQFVLAGNDSEGLRYGTILTGEKYFLNWKEDEADNEGFKLDKYLMKMFAKDRVIELMHDFVVFDGGVKKLPRAHQYFGVKEAQEHVLQRKGGIIWHTQGSGKSIVMVLLAKWILETNPHARVAIVTDRDELDKQIERVFTDAGETIYRTNSGRNLMAKLGEPLPRLLCSLVHKFGSQADDIEAFIKEVEAAPSSAIGEIFVFVDECHRTQSGKLHRAMKALLPNAVFIGFTGTPLLKRDKATSLEVFGGYIHTYKFSEAVEDEVVLDLVYEARDVDQHLGSQDKVDQWFEAKTKGLNAWQQDELKKKWGTMQNVLSSKSRMDRVVKDIVFDFNVKPRLSSNRGNAILVASSIFEACRYYSLFQQTPLKGKCGLVTSYNPHAQHVTLEETGANSETDKQIIYNTYMELLEGVDAGPGKSRTEVYEENAKALFISEPATMKLLIVVDKLLTGFDAPPCTYLYIDKSMQDHGLFQAICRTNRLDGEDKEFGYIVDYKDLFKKVENAIAVYASDELDTSTGDVDPNVLLQDRLKIGRERLDNAIEKLALLCEPVEAPQEELQHIHYFCGNSEIPEDLEERAPRRATLYQSTATLVRAYAAIADEMEAAGYSADDITRIKMAVQRYTNLREIIKKASGETIDLKAYEADMRHLIDTYIEADEPRKISPFDDLSLLELIVKSGIADAIASRLNNMQGNPDAIAETIENNVRSTIIKEHLNDPAYFEKMSALLQEVIADRKAKAIEYEEYLERIAELARQVETGHPDDTPETLDTAGKRALYNNLGQDEELALEIDKKVREVRPNGWRGIQAKERVIQAALYEILQDLELVDKVFAILKANPEY